MHHVLSTGRCDISDEPGMRKLHNPLRLKHLKMRHTLELLFFVFFTTMNETTLEANIGQIIVTNSSREDLKKNNAFEAKSLHRFQHNCLQNFKVLEYVIYSVLSVYGSQTKNRDSRYWFHWLKAIHIHYTKRTNIQKSRYLATIIIITKIKF